MPKELEARINRLIGKLNTVEELACAIANASDRKRLIHNRESGQKSTAYGRELKSGRRGPSSIGYDMRVIRRCKFRRIEPHEAFGPDNVDQ